MKLVGNIGQWLSVFVMSYGIYIYIKSGSDLGTILFSSGCILDVLATKIKYYGDKYIEKNKKILRILEEKGEIELYHEEKSAVGGQLDMFLKEE